MLLNYVPLDNYIPLIEKDGVVCVPGVLTEDARRRMLEEFAHYKLNMAYEDAGLTRPLSYYVLTHNEWLDEGALRDDSMFLRARDELDDYLNREFESKFPGYRSEALAFNHISILRYPPGAQNKPHTDGEYPINLVAILVLEGKARFGTCDDAKKTKTREIRNEAGDLLLLRGAKLLGSDVMPMHFVDSVVEERKSAVFRHMKIP